MLPPTTPAHKAKSQATWCCAALLSCSCLNHRKIYSLIDQAGWELLTWTLPTSGATSGAITRTDGMSMGTLPVEAADLSAEQRAALELRRTRESSRQEREQELHRRSRTRAAVIGRQCQ